MDVRLSISEEKTGSIKEEVQKDTREASLKEETTGRTAEQQYRAQVHTAARELADVIKGADVEKISSQIKAFSHRTDIFNVQELSRGSLLHIAAATGKSSIVGLLLGQCGAHLIAAADDWGNTPLHIATKANASEAASMLINGARDSANVKNILTTKNIHGNTPLHEAVLTRDDNLVSLLLREYLEPVYSENVDKKSPLYLALDTGNSEILQVFLSHSLDPSRIQGLPPVHGAIVRDKYDLVEQMLERDVELFAMTDSKDGNVFHLAAFLNKPRVFDLLRPETEYLARKWDKNGDLPIHIASKMGHIELIKKLHPISRSVNRQGQTVLHVAAKYGRAFAVSHILRHQDLGMLINERDNDGNTPSHLAAKYSQPAALIPLSLHERSDPTLLNRRHLTAIDIALDRYKRESAYRKLFAFMLLLSVSAENKDLIILKPEARDKAFPKLGVNTKLPNGDLLKDLINFRLMVATLVTTVTFAAGFAVPGGYNCSDMASKDYLGMATMLDNRMFQAFMICNTIAMFCSMTSVIGLMLVPQGDIEIAIAACRRAIVPLSIALPAMSAAFLTGVTLTIGKLPWLATTILILGYVFLLIITGASLSQYFPSLSWDFPIFCRPPRPIRPMISWLILASIHFLGVERSIPDESEEDRSAGGTSAVRSLSVGGED